MGNPLLRAQRNTGKRPERPEPITPVPESYAGNNQPYRGIQDHGVQPTYDPADPSTYSVDVNGRHVPIEYVPDVKEPDPIPVKIVQATAREYRRWQSDRLSVNPNTGLPTNIVGRDDTRQRVTILNTTADKTVYLAADPGDLSLRGYPLLPGKEWSSNTEEDVWAISADATAVVVGVSIEKVVAEKVKRAN